MQYIRVTVSPVSCETGRLHTAHNGMVGFMPQSNMLREEEHVLLLVDLASEAVHTACLVAQRVSGLGIFARCSFGSLSCRALRMAATRLRAQKGSWLRRACREGQPVSNGESRAWKGPGLRARGLHDNLHTSTPLQASDTVNFHNEARSKLDRESGPSQPHPDPEC